MDIFVLDSEGIENSGPRSGKVFVLMGLLCSVLVYNSVGVIDERSIEQLGIASHLNELLRVQNTPVFQVPYFVWTLRDFMLQLSGEHGEITAKKYLDKTLKATNQGHISELERTGTLLLRLFEDRDCVVFGRLGRTDNEVSDSMNTNNKQLPSEFSESLRKLRQFTIYNCPIKIVGDNELTGKVFGILAKTIVNSINAGTFDDPSDCWTEVLTEHYEGLYKAVVNEFNLRKEFILENMPYDDSELYINFYTAKSEALNVVRRSPIYHEEEDIKCKEEFEQYFNESLQLVVHANKVASETYNHSLMKVVFEGIVKKLDMKYEMDFDELVSDWHYATKEYEERAIGYSKYHILSEYLGSHYHSSFAELYTQLKQRHAEETVCSKQKYNQIEEQTKKVHQIITSHKAKLTSTTEQVIYIKIERISDCLNLPYSNAELSIQIGIITQKLAPQ